MRVGQLSQKTGVSVRMLRYYEQQGLLQPGRSQAGYRDYDENHLLTVRRIVLLNNAGLRLSTIRQILACADPGTLNFMPCDTLKDSIRERMTELDKQVAGIMESRKLLASIIGAVGPDGSPC
jgi:DNA-binding transcriptional MerR regulator